MVNALRCVAPGFTLDPDPYHREQQSERFPDHDATEI